MKEGDREIHDIRGREREREKERERLSDDATRDATNLSINKGALLLRDYEIELWNKKIIVSPAKAARTNAHTHAHTGGRTTSRGVLRIDRRRQISTSSCFLLARKKKCEREGYIYICMPRKTQCLTRSARY